MPAAAHTEKDGTLHQHPAAAAVAPQGGRAARRLPLGAVVLLPPGPHHPREAGRLAATTRPSRARPARGTTRPRARSPSRAPRRCSARSTASARTASALRATPSSRRTAPPRAAAGSTAACSPTATNQAARRMPGTEQTWVAPEWGWAWPANRRILYNRASADPEGRPWSQRKRYVWWDERERKWTGDDVPDFEPDKRPDYVPPDGAKAQDAIARQPPVHHAGRRPRAGCTRRPAWSTARSRPTTSRRSRRSRTRSTASGRTRPASGSRARATSTTDDGDGDRFPFVFTTYRLTEHHTAGGMSRTLAYLSELQPAMFCEVSPAAGGRTRPGARRLGDDRHPPLRDRGAGAGDRSPAAAAGAGPGRAPGGAALPLGLARARHAATPPTTWCAIVLDPNVHIQEVRRPPATSARAGWRPGARRWSSGHERVRRADGIETYGTTRSSAWASSPTPASASAARRARWPARSGTPCPRTGWCSPPSPTTTPASWVPTPGATWPSSSSRPRPDDGDRRTRMRWLMSSDVCKHCTHAACLDVCPTGALFRTEFGTVVVQEDVCNGCGYCVPACPFGVIDRRETRTTAAPGSARSATTGSKDGHEPACAKACPTESIQFGPLDELRERAARAARAAARGGDGRARLYGADPDDGVGGFGAFFLLLDEPEVYGLPPDPVDTTRDLPAMWRRRAGAAGAGWPAVAAGRRWEGGDDGRARWCPAPSRAPTTAGRSSSRRCGSRRSRWYLFAGGLAGASAVAGAGRRLAGNERAGAHGALVAGRGRRPSARRCSSRTSAGPSGS